MTVQSYFKNFGIAITWFERIAPIPVFMYMVDRTISIYSQVGLQKSLILFVLTFFVFGKWIYQYWIKPFIWRNKEKRQEVANLFWNYDRINNPPSELSLRKKMIAFIVLGFVAMTSGTVFFLFLIKGNFQAIPFLSAAAIFIISFRYFSYIVKSLG